MIKTLTLIMIVLGVLTAISALIPDVVTSTIDNAIIYFLQTIYYLNFLVNAETIIISLQILANFYIGVGVFWIIHWIFFLIK